MNMIDWGLPHMGRPSWSNEAMMQPIRRFVDTRSKGLWLVSLSLWLICAPAAHAAELVMFESSGCAYCRMWDQQIGGIYPRSDLGAEAPLRRVDIDAPRPRDLRAITGVVFTPTFVLVEDGAEVGRITGYIGEYQFWGLLDRMIAGLRARRETLPLSPATFP